jgi:hypothetical protein
VQDGITVIREHHVLDQTITTEELERASRAVAGVTFDFEADVARFQKVAEAIVKANGSGKPAPGSLAWVARRLLESLRAARALRQRGDIENAMREAFSAGREAQHMADKLVADPTMRGAQRGRDTASTLARGRRERIRAEARKMLNVKPTETLDGIARALAGRPGLGSESRIRKAIVGLK